MVAPGIHSLASSLPTHPARVASASSPTRPAPNGHSADRWEPAGRLWDRAIDLRLRPTSTSRLLDLDVLQGEPALDRGCAGFVPHEVHPGREPDSVDLM